ncbi:MAG: hypothetical protein HYZ34_15515, partial [Ignavibacteriae bacterium]|nr:hypothetical protein [Ignavibacteriota bacterium]
MTERVTPAGFFCFAKIGTLVGMVLRLVLRTYSFFLIGCLVFATSSLFAQSAWRHIGVNDGLAQGFVNAMLQDSRGFMWFGTSDGLSRYDGYSFKNYRNDPTDTTTISTGIVSALHECKSGLLWVGFLAGNIDIFDRATERFIHLDEVQWSPTIVPQLFSIAEDITGLHWVGREGEILLIEQTRNENTFLSSASFHVTVHKEGLKTGNQGNTIITYADHSGNIWVWNNSFIHIINRSLPHPPVFRRGVGQLSMSPGGMVEDQDGVFWFLIYDLLYSFLYSYNPATGVTTNINHEPLPVGKPRPIIAVDRSRFLWIVARDFLKINTRDTRQQTFIKSQTQGDQLRILIDRGDILWVGTNGFGIDQYNTAIERFGAIPRMKFPSLVMQTMEAVGFPRRKGITGDTSTYADLYNYSVFRDRNGNEWYPCVPSKDDLGGTIGDVVWYDSTAGTINKIRRQKRGEALTPQTFPISSYVKMLEDRTGVQWFIGWEALSAYDSVHNRFRHYLIHNGALGENNAWRDTWEFRITSPRKDNDGYFWFGVFQEGLFRFDPVTLALKRFSHNAHDTTSLSSNNVISLTEDPDEPEKFYWIGTEGGGLNKFEKTSGTCSRYTTRNGLPNNVIYTVFPDKNRKLWLSTNNGLCRLDPKTMTFKYYDIYDGLQGMEFNRERNFQTADGKIYLEGTGGVNIFYPEEITENPHIPPLVFTDLKIRGASVSWLDEHSPLKQSITETKEIVLPYDQNILTFEFAALDFSNSGSNEYSYRLEEYSEEWTKPSKDNSATFTNLNPGKYILHVRGSNNDGVWNEQGITLSLIILPPWYRTWWAYLGYVGIFFTVLIFFRRYDLKRIRLKDQLELAQVRANQLKEVDQLKMKFFQNISHEFRTPLTLILGPIEKLLNGSVPKDTVKRDLRLMRRNAQRLLRLINQLLDISKLEAGGMKLQASKGNIVAFIRGVTMSFHSLAERKEMFFDVQADAEEVEIYFDKEKMEKIVINLLSNAFKFTPDHGEITVVITSVSSFPRGEGQGVRAREAVKISVRDTGIGIPPEKLPHIFDRFYQVDSSSTRMQEGTG